MSGLSNLGAVLTIIFVFSLLALFAQLFFVICRRRRVFHLRTQSPAAATAADSNSSSFTSSLSSLPKELLYYFFRHKSSRVEPTPNPPIQKNSATEEEEDEMEVIDIFKLQNMYGPSRVLFTIKEEDDRENDHEDQLEMSVNCSPAATTKKQPNGSGSKRVSLEECLKAGGGEVAMAVEDDNNVSNAIAGGGGDPINGEIIIMTTTTPNCESPDRYFTPLASPTQIHL